MGWQVYCQRFLEENWGWIVGSWLKQRIYMDSSVEIERIGWAQKHFESITMGWNIWIMKSLYPFVDLNGHISYHFAMFCWDLANSRKYKWIGIPLSKSHSSIRMEFPVGLQFSRKDHWSGWSQSPSAAQILSIYTPILIAFLTVAKSLRFFIRLKTTSSHQVYSARSKVVGGSQFITIYRPRDFTSDLWRG
jgi:hypothetical protein